MSRKESGWEWPAGPHTDGRYSWEAVRIHILQDIRDELQRIRRYRLVPVKGKHA